MDRYYSEVVVLEVFNNTDYKVLDKNTRKEIGFMLRKADAKQGFDLHAYFNIPKHIEFPKNSKTLMEGWGIFNRIYSQI
jgi:hypothetical protein